MKFDREVGKDISNGIPATIMKKPALSRMSSSFITNNTPILPTLTQSRLPQTHELEPRLSLRNSKNQNRFPFLPLKIYSSQTRSTILPAPKMIILRLALGLPLQNLVSPWQSLLALRLQPPIPLPQIHA